MIRLLGMLVVILGLLAGIGYYRGWFRAESRDVHGEPAVTVTVDKDKIDQDKAKAQKDVQDIVHK